MTKEEISPIIHMAWQDRITFDEIEQRTGLREANVIKIMRANLKPSSFRMWRKRVTGRVTKHRKLMQEQQRTHRPRHRDITGLAGCD